MGPTMAFTYKEYLNQNLIASQLHTLNPILTTFLKCLLVTSDIEVLFSNIIKSNLFGLIL